MICTTVQHFKAARSVLLSTLLAGMLLSLVFEARGATGSSGTFALTGSLNTARYQHTATLLNDGQVLVTGGLGVEGAYTTLASAELYNPSTGKWISTGNMSVNRAGFTATLLENGEVLVAGGSDYEINCWATAELYNPSTGEWSLTGSMTQPRCLHSATLLSNGDVLVSGGVDSLGLPTTPVLLSNGDVLIGGLAPNLQSRHRELDGYGCPADDYVRADQSGAARQWQRAWHGERMQRHRILQLPREPNGHRLPL